MFMKNKSALQIMFLVFIMGCSTNVIDENDLVEKSSLAYLKNSETPFSGKINGKFKNGNNRIIGQYTEGKKVGDWFLFYDNGNEKEKGSYSNGIKIVTWLSYYKDGVISSKGIFCVALILNPPVDLVSLIKSFAYPLSTALLTFEVLDPTLNISDISNLT